MEKIDIAKLREMLQIPDGVTFDLLGGSIHPETIDYIDRLEAFAVEHYNRESAGRRTIAST